MVEEHYTSKSKSLGSKIYSRFKEECLALIVVTLGEGYHGYSTEDGRLLLLFGQHLLIGYEET